MPYALHDRDAYAAVARRRFSELGFELESVHERADPHAVLRDADGLFIGGGNTFRLLDALIATGLREAIRERALAGMPYLGTSAGSNVACPTIRTTNDMPIVQPESFAALDLVPFQLNPHYVDADPSSTHQGETRDQRLAEYLEENERPVVGLREGALLVVEGDRVTLRGGARRSLLRPRRAAGRVSAGPAGRPARRRARLARRPGGPGDQARSR